MSAPGWPFAPQYDDGAPVELHAVRDEPPPRVATSWTPVDLAGVLDGGHREPEPTLLRRDDGPGLLYPGRTHSVSGEPECLKSWLVQLGCVDELAAGNHVVYVDYEDTAAGVAARLRALGVDRATLLERFHYVRPDERLTPDGKRDLAPALDPWPSLVVLDGVTEAMALHGLDPLSNSDFAAWHALLPRPLAAKGSAVVVVDHVTKAREDRGRYAIGAQHKLAALSGAAYTVELVRPFGHGLHGLARVVVGKDRPGQVRAHAGPPRPDRTQVAAELHLRSEEDGTVLAELLPPAARGEQPFRPTTLMERVSRALEDNPAGMTSNAIGRAVTGKAEHIRTALARLLEEGFVSVEDAANRSRVYHTRAAFRGDEEAG